MAIPQKLTPGQRVSGLLGGTHNWTVDQLSRLVAGQLPAEPRQAGATRGALIQNRHTAALNKSYGVLRLERPVNDPNATGSREANRALLRLRGEAPDQQTVDGRKRIGIVQRGVAVGKWADVVINGYTWARVNIVNEADEVCGPLLDDVDKLQSGTGGIEIVWKPTGTGEKICLIRLGSRVTASVGGNLAVVTVDLPLASYADFSGAVSTWEITPGVLGDPLVPVDPAPPASDGVLLFDWKRTNTQVNDYLDSPYETPPTKLTAVYENPPDGGANLVPAYRAGYNVSKTNIRASVDEPVLVTGFQQEFAQDDDTYRTFFVTNVMDLRSLPGFVKGQTPAQQGDPNKDTDLQLAGHSGGEDAHKLLLTADCEASS